MTIKEKFYVFIADEEKSELMIQTQVTSLLLKKTWVILYKNFE